MPNINSANNRFLNQPVTTTATNYIALPSDVIIEVTNTSAPRTITLPTPLVNGNVGKSFLIKDSSGAASVNNITVMPASGTIDGIASLVISANYGVVQVYCDGTAYYSYSNSGTGTLAVIERTFTTSGTYNPTVGMLYCEVEMVGGGGAGGGATATTAAQNSLGSGGGAGEHSFGLFSAAQIGANQTITIGAGGTGSSGAAGSVGGTTSFGSLMTTTNNYYTQNSALTTLTLPAAASAGTLIQIAGVGAGGWILAQNAGQSINFGNQVTTTGTGGSIASTNQYDGADILCVVANTQWVVRAASGNLKVT